VRAEEEEEKPLHAIFGPDPVPRREQVEHQSGDGGDGERCRDVVHGGQGLIEPVMDRMPDELGLAIGVAERQP